MAMRRQGHGQPRGAIRVRLRLPFAAMTLCLVGLGLAGAGSASGDAPAVSLAVAPLPPIPNANDFGADFVGNNTVAKAKVTIAIPLTLFQVDAVITNQDPKDSRYSLADAKAWPRSPAGQSQKYGLFAPIKTSVLGFGVIPVTATVHLSQYVLNNQLVPFVIHGRGLNQPPFTSDSLYARGMVDLRVSDVAVDGVPLDVGTNCHTSTPLNLALTGKYNNASPPPPGYYNISNGGLLSGLVTIPSFTNCHSSSEDLDPLLTGMISGPGNPLRMVQGTLNFWQPPDSCPACTPPTAAP